ncbi:hypothetical protein ACOSP7_005201 [Xanthoceras sorbifolium]
MESSSIVSMSSNQHTQNTTGRSWDDRLGTLVQFQNSLNGWTRVLKMARLYVCFGSVFRFSAAQLLEIAMGLEASKHHFIWVQINNEDKEEWMPEGFEERMQGKGFIKRGWTPLIQILEHEAAEGFLTHCECNSILESIAAGVPMVT